MVRACEHDLSRVDATDSSCIHVEATSLDNCCCILDAPAEAMQVRDPKWRARLPAKHANDDFLVKYRHARDKDVLWRRKMLGATMLRNLV